MKYLIILLLLISCGGESEVQKEFNEAVKSVHKINCFDIGNKGTFMERCENSEVLCYGMHNYGMQCKFKEKK